VHDGVEPAQAPHHHARHEEARGIDHDRPSRADGRDQDPGESRPGDIGEIGDHTVHGVRRLQALARHDLGDHAAVRRLPHRVQHPQKEPVRCEQGHGGVPRDDEHCSDAHDDRAEDVGAPDGAAAPEPVGDNTPHQHEHHQRHHVRTVHDAE